MIIERRTFGEVTIGQLFSPRSGRSSTLLQIEISIKNAINRTSRTSNTTTTPKNSTTPTSKSSACQPTKNHKSNFSVSFPSHPHRDSHPAASNCNHRDNTTTIILYKISKRTTSNQSNITQFAPTIEQIAKHKRLFRNVAPPRHVTFIRVCSIILRASMAAPQKREMLFINLTALLSILSVCFI